MNPYEEAGQGAAEFESGPGGVGQDALVGGAVAPGERAEGARQVSDGASPGGQDGGGQEGEEALPGGSVDERTERLEQRQGFGW